MSSKTIQLGMLLAAISVASSLSFLADKRDGAEISAQESPDKPYEWDGKSTAVHEWGTFTGVQGSDGVVVNGLYHHDRDLPGFVHDITETQPITAIGVKMETPVIYFYSPEKRSQFQVEVTFPRGIVTQWYPIAPEANFLELAKANGEAHFVEPTPITSLENGYIRWGQEGDRYSTNLVVLSPKEEPELPKVSGDDPWRFSREVDANHVRCCWHDIGETGTSRASNENKEHEYERFLFYRGLGDFPLPLKVSVSGECYDDSAAECLINMTISNTAPSEPLLHVYVVCVKDGKSGFTYLPSVTESVSLESFAIHLETFESSTNKLVEHLADSLTATGLFHKEALAMARTWQHGYFQDEGLRVLYVVPNSVINRELPLSVGDGFDGKFDGIEEFSTVRTFVGRIEAMSPERESEIEHVIVDYMSDDPELRNHAIATIESWGRLAVPYLNRIIALTSDTVIEETANRLLEELDPMKAINTSMTPDE